jgi:hypothetical protein
MMGQCQTCGRVGTAGERCVCRDTPRDADAAASPRFEHDCDRCTYLGREGDSDLYFCGEHYTGPTVIARYGKGALFISGAQWVPALGEAKKRALERELLAR